MVYRLVACLFLLLLSACTVTEEVVYEIRDECGPVQGQVLHSIKDVDTCRIRCRGQCQALEHEFVRSHFIDQGVKCHLCNCTCLVTRD
jgi:hypothetical protein